MFLRIAWRTVAAIVARVVADGRDTNETCVADHTTGRLVWAGVRAMRCSAAIGVRPTNLALPAANSRRMVPGAKKECRGFPQHHAD